ncbi:MAG TPA: zinc ABC transporter substrate-binding protein [Thermoanaerobacterales bacterium]|nr:zinc ABC transporter substrate-binding protein [Thermoanaerobacterales bacterium]
MTCIRKTMAFITIFFLIFSMAGCAAKRADFAPEGVDSDRPVIYTTFYPLYDFTKKIAGDKAQVESIIPAGVEPHDFEPSPRQIAEIYDARVFVFLGGDMEPWAQKLEGQLRGRGITVVEAGKDLIENHDPHIWLDPVLAKEMALRIYEAVASADAGNKSYYEENFNKLASGLDELDKNYRENLSDLNKKDFITSHEAFGYMAKRYGLRQISIKGLSPQEEPSPKKMADLAELCRQKDIKYIFFETLASPKLSETLAREVGARTMVLNPIDGLTPEEIKAGADYFSIMQKNLENLKKALSE